jgi:drug/metabolite transporter (DMT)-like permease
LPPDSSAGKIASRPGRYAFAALLLANLFLAFGPWMVRMADVGPTASAFWRLSLAIPLLLLFARCQSPAAFRPGRALAVTILLAGLFFAADLAAWHYGIVRTKMANATLFGNSSTILFAAYGFIAARMLPRPSQAAAILLAIVGAILLLGSSYELSPRNFVGDLFAILAGFFYAFYLIAIDRARKVMAPMPVLALATVAGAGPLLLFALFLGEKVMPGDWGPVVLLSLGSQVIGQGLLVYCMGHLSPVVVGVGLLTQPAVAAAIGWLAYGERLSLADAAGAVLIALALLLIRLPDRRLATGDPEPHLGDDRRVR